MQGDLSGSGAPPNRTSQFLVRSLACWVFVAASAPPSNVARTIFVHNIREINAARTIGCSNMVFGIVVKRMVSTSLFLEMSFVKCFRNV